jgi:hypothetical protein
MPRGAAWQADRRHPLGRSQEALTGRGGRRSRSRGLYGRYGGLEDRRWREA